MESNRIQTGIKAGLSVLLASSILGLLYVNNLRSDLNAELTAEKAQLQNTLEAKEILSKKLLSTYAELEDFKSENADLKKSVSLKEDRIAALNNEVAQTNRWKQKSGKLQKEIGSLKAEIARLKKEQENLQQSGLAEQRALQNRINVLQAQVTALEERLAGNTIVAANYFRIEALRGKKDKLTRRAKRTHRILVSFHAGEELLKASQSGNLYLSVSGPGAQKITQANAETVAIQLGDKRVEIPVVAKAQLQKMKQGRQEIVMHTTARLKPGIYQADVYSDTHHLGGAQIRLD